MDGEQVRWWDGTEWTSVTRPAQGSVSTESGTAGDACAGADSSSAPGSVDTGRSGRSGEVAEGGANDATDEKGETVGWVADACQRFGEKRKWVRVLQEDVALSPPNADTEPVGLFGLRLVPTGQKGAGFTALFVNELVAWETSTADRVKVAIDEVGASVTTPLVGIRSRDTPIDLGYEGWRDVDSLRRTAGR